MKYFGCYSVDLFYIYSFIIPSFSSLYSFGIGIDFILRVIQVENRFKVISSSWQSINHDFNVGFGYYNFQKTQLAVFLTKLTYYGWKHSPSVFKCMYFESEFVNAYLSF